MVRLGAMELTAAEEGRRCQLLDAAVGYAQRGWRVIPVRWVDDDGICQCRRGKECASPGKHPIPDDWPKVATNDPVVVARWWTPPDQWSPQGDQFDAWYPQANVGIVTGRGSGILVIDVDPRNGGDESLGNLIGQHEDLPLTRIHNTGSGGLHYILEYPEDMEVGNPKNLFGPGIDIKGNGGFIVAPPSVSGAGLYEILNPVHDRDPAPVPDWIRERLQGYAAQQRGEPSVLAAPVAPVGVRRKYGLNAIEGEAGQLAKTNSGRNNALNAAAFALGQLAPDGITTEEESWQALREACIINRLWEPPPTGDGPGQCWRSFQSGWKKGQLKPFHPDWKALDVAYPLREWNSFGHGDRMVDHFGDQLRWSPGLGTWRRYEGGRWKRVPEDTGEWLGQAMIRSLPELEAPGYSDEVAGDNQEKLSPRQKFLDKVARHWSNPTTASSAARAYKGHLALHIDEAGCDADPLLICLRNGVWDARSDTLEPHHPDLLVTMRADVAFDARAACPRWDAFLAEVQPDAEIRAYLQRVAGYSLTGDDSEQSVFLHYGRGANGKSVFHSVLKGIAGSYSQAMYVDTLMKKTTDGQVPNDVAMLAGKRYLTASETRAGRQLDEAMLKQLTGGDTIASRFMRQDFFEFRQTGKIHLTTNHRPHVSDDDATWRRLHPVPWGTVVPVERRDKHLADRLLESEAPGILNWALAGLADWLARKALDPPAELETAKAGYREAEDIIGRFASQGVTVDESMETSACLPAKVLKPVFDMWILPDTVKMSVRTFSESLANKIEPRTSHNTNVWPVRIADPVLARQARVVTDGG